jgi:hypothetical protein
MTRFARPPARPQFQPVKSALPGGVIDIEIGIS